MVDTQTGAVLAMYSNPTYDPNRIVNPDFDAARVGPRGTPRGARQPAAGQRLPGALHARVDVQGADDRHRPRGRGGLPRQPVRARHRVDAAADVEPDPELRRHRTAAATSARCSGAAATCRSPRRPSTSASPGWSTGCSRVGRRRADAVHRTCSLVRRRARSATRAASSDRLPLLAMRGFGQQEDQMVPLHMAMVAAAVANNGVMMKPYVVASTTDSQGRTLTRTRPEEWLRPISRGDRGDAQLADAERRHRRHGELLPASQRRRPGRRQDGHGAAQRRRPAGAVERLDHRLRPRRPAALRRGRRAPGQPRGVAGTGGRLAGPIAQQMLNEALANG